LTSVTFSVSISLAGLEGFLPRALADGSGAGGADMGGERLGWMDWRRAGEIVVCAVGLEEEVDTEVAEDAVDEVLAACAWLM